MRSPKFLAIAQVMTAFGLWSTLGIFFNAVQLPVSVYVVFGSLVGLAVLYGYFYLTRHRLPRFRFSMSLAILFLVAAVKGVIWFRALSLYPIAKAMLVHNLAPVVAIILSSFVLREKPSLNHGIAIITGFLGLLLLLGIVGSPIPILGRLQV